MFKRNKKIEKKKAQTALEYLLVLGVVMGTVLVGLRTFLPQTYVSANRFFNEIANEIMGEAPE